MSWKQLDTRTVYENPWMEVREDRVGGNGGQVGTFLRGRRGHVEGDPGAILAHAPGVVKNRPAVT